MVEPHEFQDDYILGSWKYSTSIVHELRLRMLAIFKWVNVLWSVSKGALVRINTHIGSPDTGWGPEPTVVLLFGNVVIRAW
jgi:hypothetical protein